MGEKSSKNKTCTAAKQKVNLLMTVRTSWGKMIAVFLVHTLLILITPYFALADATHGSTAGNFGLPGIIDLPTAKRFKDGELVVTQQLHKSLLLFSEELFFLILLSVL